jgi:hypothetical protein
MTKTLSRRAFLLSAAAAGGAAAVASTGKTALKPASRREGKRGYHATEHVNNYYRTTKV